LAGDPSCKPIETPATIHRPTHLSRVLAATLIFGNVLAALSVRTLSDASTPSLSSTPVSLSQGR
ncbi:hypothetical protein, partial [Pseudomonas viridiflava]|uniref:hypothetical protein n=1 Tax=Pseudomonas viridiflava TaxID=33069 RepID=UPI0019D22824